MENFTPVASLVGGVLIGLAGVIIDPDGSGRSYNVEAKRRPGESWKLLLEARGVFNVSPGDFLYQSRRDNSFRFTLAKYF